MLRPGEKSSSTFTPRFADQIMFDTHTQALVDEMEKGLLVVFVVFIEKNRK